MTNKQVIIEDIAAALNGMSLERGLRHLREIYTNTPEPAKWALKFEIGSEEDSTWSQPAFRLVIEDRPNV